MDCFDHDRLDAYRIAREFARALNELLTAVPRGRSDLVDQARRSSLSICLNLVEGSGEFTGKEKVRFYRMARRSATECAGILDHLIDIDRLTAQQIEPLRRLLIRLVSTLVRLIQATEQRPIRADRRPDPDAR